MKRLFIVTIVTALFTTLFFSNYNVAYAADDIGLDAESAILIDAKSGKILYEKNSEISLPTASMAKMMTEYLVLEAIEDGKLSWEQEVGISEYAHRISQNRKLSNVPLRIDYKYNIKELYEAMAIYSANGATIALADAVAGSEAGFVKMMNDRAAELKLEKYNFVNSTGLNNSDLMGMHPAGAETDENMLSARDTAKLAYHLIKEYPEMLEIASIPKKTFREGTDDAINMSNWNWMLPELVYAYEGVDGLKTGSTDMAGYSFTATAQRNGVRLISVVMKTTSYQERFKQTAKLLDYGFNNFVEKELYPANHQIKGKSVVPVVKGKEKSVKVATNAPLKVLMKLNEEEFYSAEYELNKKLLTEDGELTAAVKKGMKVGEMKVVYSGEQDLGYIEKERKGDSVDVVTKAAVEKANWFVLVISGIGEFFSDVFTTTADKVKKSME